MNLRLTTRRKRLIDRLKICATASLLMQSEESVCTSGVASPRNSRFSEPRKGAGLSGGWTSPLEVTTLRRLPNAEAQASCVFSGERLLSADFSQREGEAGTLGVLVSAVMQRGFAGLYQGLSLQLIKTALASSILFLVKEQVHAQTALVSRSLKHPTRSLFRSRRTHAQLFTSELPLSGVA